MRTPPPPAGPEDSGRIAWRALGLPAAYLLFRWILAAVELPPATPGWALAAAAVLVAAGGIGLPVAAIAALIRATGRAPRPAVAGLGVAVGGLALWLGLAAAVAALPPGAQPAVAALQDLGKILAASGVGVALAHAVPEPNLLLPAGLFAAFADVVVVHFGTVKHALATPQGQALVQAVSARVPSPHARLPALTIGPADFLFLGIFLACAARFGWGLRRNALALAAVLALALMLVWVVGPIPALAPMGLAFLALNARRFRLTREELLSTVVVLLGMGGLFLGYFLLLAPARR